MAGPVTLRSARLGDADAIAQIYAHYVSNSAITFEVEPPSAAEIRKRMKSSDGLYPWLVATDGERVLGYAYASQFKARSAYRFSVETTIYLDPAARGHGIGRTLYAKLIDTVEQQGFASAVASVSLPNPASLSLHAALGFRHVGVHRQIGFKSGWHDVAQLQRPFPISERPSEPTPFGAIPD